MAPTTIGVLALQGAFSEHIQLLRRAATASSKEATSTKTDDLFPDGHQIIEVRTANELERCHALVIPGGESTTMSLVAERSGLLEPLRAFVKRSRKPTWGTCAGMILLAESANRTKKGGQELVGGLDVRVNRNHFGRQTESFVCDLDLPFLKAENQDHGGGGSSSDTVAPFQGVFIRAPVVEKLLRVREGEQVDEARLEDTVVAPSRKPEDQQAARFVGGEVEVLATLQRRKGGEEQVDEKAGTGSGEERGHTGDIIAVRQGNVFATSFHPELTGDARIHRWWLEQVKLAINPS